MQDATKTTILNFVLFIVFITFSNSSLAYDPYDCLNDVASIDTGINIGLATELCSAAWSPEPAKCYQGASEVDEEIPRFIAIELCAGSENAEKTLACYAKSGSRQLNKGLAATLCGANKIKN